MGQKESQALMVFLDSKEKWDFQEYQVFVVKLEHPVYPEFKVQKEKLENLAAMVS